jgi:hypothetical protein
MLAETPRRKESRLSLLDTTTTATIWWPRWTARGKLSPNTSTSREPSITRGNPGESGDTESRIQNLGTQYLFLLFYEFSRIWGHRIWGHNTYFCFFTSLRPHISLLFTSLSINMYCVPRFRFFILWILWILRFPFKSVWIHIGCTFQPQHTGIYG